MTHVRNGIVDLVEKQDFSLFATAVEAVMSGFSGQDAIVAEDAYVCAFSLSFLYLFTLLLTPYYSLVYGNETGFSPRRQNGYRVQSRPTNSQGRRKWCCC
jgi:hypothetical protein